MSEPEGPTTDRPDAVGPVDPLKVPRFAGPATFARLPRLDEVDRCDVAVVGVPSTAASPTARVHGSARTRFARLAAAPPLPPGARCRAVRRAAGRRRRRHRVNPFDIQEAIAPDRGRARTSCSRARRSCWRSVVTTRSRCRSCGSMKRRHGPVALVHFDAHLDTWDTYFGAPYTHGTPFRRAWEEGLLAAGPRDARGHPRSAVLAGATSSTTSASASRSWGPWR